MDSWRIVWREGVAPQLSTEGLEALERALATDDRRLIQGMTTTPPPVPGVEQCCIEGACAVGFCAWQGDGLETVGELEEHFARVCFETDRRLGEPTACRRFLNWYDDAPRADVRRRLLDEVHWVLARRRAPGKRKKIEAAA